jgi:hypothetical protein
MRWAAGIRAIPAVVLVTTLSSCGGSDVDQEALIAALAAEAAADEQSLIGGDSAAAGCFATGVVERVGANRLDELGMTPDNVPGFADLALNDDERAAISDALFSCIDVRALLSARLAEQVGEELGLCIATNLSEDVLRVAFPGPATDAVQEEFENQLQQCREAIEGNGG